MSTIQKELCLKYFDTWSSKNTDELSKMFASDIMLLDWELSASGLFDVITANQKIFNSVETLRVEVSEMIQEPNEFVQKVICFITIWVNEGTDSQQVLSVMDAIHFNEDNKIHLIRAYRGF